MRKLLLILTAFLIFSANSFSQWVEMNKNLEGGQVSAIVANDNYLFVLTANGLMYRSSDDGNNWEAMKTPLDNNLYLPITKIAAKGKVLAVCSSYFIYLSQDNGNSWIEIKTNNNPFSSLLIDDVNVYYNYQYSLFSYSFEGKSYFQSLPFNGGYINYLAQKNSLIIAASNKGVATSTDHGRNWVFSDTGLIKNRYISNLFVFGNNIYVSYDNYLIFESTDNGRHWDTSKTINNIEVKQIAENGNKIFCINKYNTLYISTDGGKNWSKSNKGMTENNVNYISVKNQSVYALTDNYIYKYSDADGSWNRTNINYCFRDAFCVSGVGTRLFAFYDKIGITTTTDNGFSWDTSNISLKNRKINSFTVHNNDIYALTDSGIYTITSESNKWVIVKGTNIAPNAKGMVFLGDTMFVLFGEYGMYKSPVDKVQLQNISRELYSTKYTGLAESENVLYVASAGEGIYKSENHGVNWTQPTKGLGSLSIKDICTSWKNIYVIGNYMKYTNNGPIFLTTNAGTKWQSISNGIDSGVTISCIAAKANKVFAGSTTQGVYYSTDYGTSWQKLNQGLNNYSINYLSIVGPDVYAGTKGGIYKYPSLLDVEEKPATIDNFYLSCYPNPFTDYSTVIFYNEKPYRVTISLYDIFGKEVKSIFSDILPVGSQKFEITSEELSSGMYFLRVQRENKIKVLKIELIK